MLSSSWFSPEATREAIHDDITILGSLSYDSSNSISRASLKLQLEDFVENRLLRRAGIRVGGIRSASEKASNALCLAGFFNDGSGPDRPGWLPPDGLTEDELDGVLGRRPWNCIPGPLHTGLCARDMAFTHGLGSLQLSRGGATGSTSSRRGCWHAVGSC